MARYKSTVSCVLYTGRLYERQWRSTKSRCLVILGVIVPTMRSFLAIKCEFYRDLAPLLQNVRLTDALVIASDFDTNLNYLEEAERHMGGSLSVLVDSTDSCNRLIQVCSDHKLFLENINSCP